jgi:hypothetical protein
VSIRSQGFPKEAELNLKSIRTLLLISLASITGPGCRSAYPPPPVSERPSSYFDELVDVPRDRQVPVVITFREASLKTVESVFDPSPEAVAKAKAKNPRQQHYMGLRFHYENPGWASRKLTLTTILLSENGAVLAKDSHDSALDAKTRGDTITTWFWIRTADWAEAKRLRVSAAFVE